MPPGYFIYVCGLKMWTVDCGSWCNIRYPNFALSHCFRLKLEKRKGNKPANAILAPQEAIGSFPFVMLFSQKAINILRQLLSLGLQLQTLSKESDIIVSSYIYTYINTYIHIYIYTGCSYILLNLYYGKN